MIAKAVDLLEVDPVLEQEQIYSHILVQIDVILILSLLCDLEMT